MQSRVARSWMLVCDTLSGLKNRPRRRRSVACPGGTGNLGFNSFNFMTFILLVLNAVANTNNNVNNNNNNNNNLNYNSINQDSNNVISNSDNTNMITATILPIPGKRSFKYSKRYLFYASSIRFGI